MSIKILVGFGATFFQLASIPVAILSQPALNIDFGVGVSSPKVGLAATGQGSNDFWNLYSRDDGSGGYRTLGTVANLKWADGSASDIDVTVANAPGAWHNGAPDPMFDVYLYPLGGGNITVTLNSLPVGTYDFYVYGHGGPNADNQNGVFQVQVGGTDYGQQATTTGPSWVSPVWQEGRQYVVFRDVGIPTAGQTLDMTVLPGASGYPIINGMQFVFKSTNLPPSCVPSPDGLVSWWPGNGNANDVAGSNSGTLSGGTSYADGEAGQAFSFDGIDDQVSFGNTVGNFDTNDFTVEFWLKTTSTRHEAVIEKMPSCAYSSLWTIWIGGAAPWGGPGRLEAQTFSDAAASDANSISAGRAINDGLFHHVALVRRGTNLLFYIDGVADVATNVMSGTVTRLNNAANLVVGTSACGGNGILPFTGQMDELATYNRALSDPEIQAIFHAGSAGKCSQAASLGSMVSLDFGIGTVSPKVGPAAIGQGSNDFWNLYSRDDGSGGYRTLGTVANLKWVDGSASDIDVTVANAPGAWHNGAPDPMFDVYLYPLSGGNITVTLNSLPVGTYDFYVYGHGGPNADNQNGVFQVQVGGTEYGQQATTTGPSWDSPVWQEGRQYVVFRDVGIPTAGQTLDMTVLPGASGYPIINGMQLVFKSTNQPPPPPAKALAHWKFDETSGTTAQDSAGPYNGQLSPGGASFAPGGVLGGALSLAKSGNGFVNIGNVLGLTTGDFSIVSWVKMTAGDTTESSVILAKHAAYTRNGYNLMVNKSGGLLRENKVAFVEGGDGVGQISIDETPISTTSVNDGNWHQIVAVYQAEGTKLIYVDGAPAEDAKPSQPFNANSVPLLIGGVNFDGTPTGLFTGLIDEVQIYNFALGDADVSFLFQNPGQEIPPHDLVPGNWRLNTVASQGGNITRVPDLSEYGTGTNVTLTAVPAPGFAFFAWSGNASGTNNPLTITMDGNKIVTAGFADIASPVVAITTPTAGTVDEDEFTLSGTVADNVAVESARWEWNGQPIGNVAVTAGSYSVGGLRLYQGENRLRVIGRDLAGNEGSAEVIVTWRPTARALAHWAFDETTGTVAHDSAGTFDGGLSPAGAEFVTNGVAGGAISLSKAANGFVNMGQVLALTAGDFSVVAWVKTPAGDPTECSTILSRQEAGWANGYLLDVNACGSYSQTGKAWFYSSDNPGGEVSSTTSVNDGNWHQVVAVYQSGGNKYIYVDGQPVEAGKPAPAIVPNSGSLVIGGVTFGGVPQGLFTGLIDEVQIYNYALTGTQVDVLFSSPAQVIAEHDLPVGWSLNTTTTGNGTVQRNPDLTRYPDATNVTLTAVAASGYAFVGWSGDTNGTVNPLTLVMNGNKTITARFNDDAAPVITITTPVGGTNSDERFTLSGAITDNVGVASASWEWNGQAIDSITLTGGQFSVGSLKLKPGENRIRVLAADAAGNQGSSEVVVTWVPARTLAIVSPAPSQEGALISIPVQLISDGGVGGMSFVVRYDPAYLADPEMVWSPVVGSALNQVNYDSAGQIRATFALPATAVPAGTQTVANVTFRTRSVPVSLNTDLGLEVLDASQPTGNPITFGSTARSGVARILIRRVIGDNNATDTLDVGDSSIILRLLTGLDPVRAWDTVGNDVNASGNLDSGDVIRVLRAVVGLDPQPPVGGGFAPLGAKPKSGIRGSGLFSGLAVLSLDKTRAQPGELVTLQVRLQGIATPVSGTSLAVEYPTNALRLVNPLSYRTGGMIPGSAVALWNVAPAQTNFTAQTGRISFGASSGTSWPTNNGVVVELVFQVQPGQTAQYLWPIRLSGAAVASEGGYDVSQVLNASVDFIGRDQNPSSFEGASVAYTVNGLEMTLRGEPGLSYAIEKSGDLINWTPLKVVNNPNGTVTFVDADALNNPQRFYRAKSQ